MTNYINVTFLSFQKHYLHFTDYPSILSANTVPSHNNRQLQISFFLKGQRAFRIHQQEREGFSQRLVLNYLQMQVSCGDCLDDQSKEVRGISLLLCNLVAIDSVLLHFAVAQHIPEPDHIFFKIIKQRIPHRKQLQEELLVMLTFCFYRMLTQKHHTRHEIEMIEECFHEYLSTSPFVPDFVKYHQEVRIWASSLLSHQNLVLSRRQLNNIVREVSASSDPKLDILYWRLMLCQLMMDTILSKNAIERLKVVQIVKRYKQLKKQGKIAIQVTVSSFAFMVSQLIAAKSDLYVYFQIQLKLLKKEPLPDQVYFLIEQTLKECQEFATRKIVSAVQVYIKQNIPIRKYPEKHDQRFKKIWHNEQINQQILRKVDNFMRFRPKLQLRSQGTSPAATPRVSVSLSNDPIQFHVSLHETTRLGWFKSTSKIKRQESATSLSKTGVFPRKKRKQVYKNICKQNNLEVTVIKGQNLKDELIEIEVVQEERCKITFEQILLGQYEDNQKNEESNTLRIVGALEDQEFGTLELTFHVIFNQQIAEMRVKITKQGKNYLVECQISSTYCRHTSILVIQKASKDTSKTNLQDLHNYVESSVIYYEALQERVQRKVGVKQLQVVEQMARILFHQPLSHQQLLKSLLVVELFKAEFFWYYTKSSFINGSRIEKRVIKIELEDQSAFAVCLGKFKSDYDCCLKELIEVENMRSLIETCVYLSHGRLVVHREFRYVKGKLYLQVVTISEDVYSSFKRRSNLPYFQITVLQRSYLDLERGKVKKEGRIKVDVRSILKEADVFTFFMKNIVENFIETKFLRKIGRYLQERYEEQSKEWFQEKDMKVIPTYRLQCVSSNEIMESIEMKPILDADINNLRETLLSYCSAYHLKPQFQVKNKKKHFLTIKKRHYFGEEIELHNGLNILKLFKVGSRSTYELILYHQPPQLISLICTPFHPRAVLNHQPTASLPVVTSNLVRNSLSQERHIHDAPTLIKVVLRLDRSYCYACISESQSLLSWRLDIYSCGVQLHFATFIDEEVYFDCLSRWNSINEEVWKKALKFSKIDLLQKSITISNHKLCLFQVRKKMMVHSQQIHKSLQLIQLDSQLFCLILNFDCGDLRLSHVDDIPYNYSGSIRSTSASRGKLALYSSLMTKLYRQCLEGILPSEKISTGFFQSSMD